MFNAIMEAFENLPLASLVVCYNISFISFLISKFRMENTSAFMEVSLQNLSQYKISIRLIGSKKYLKVGRYVIFFGLILSRVITALMRKKKSILLRILEEAAQFSLGNLIIDNTLFI